MIFSSHVLFYLTLTFKVAVCIIDFSDITRTLIAASIAMEAVHGQIFRKKFIRLEMLIIFPMNKE